MVHDIFIAFSQAPPEVLNFPESELPQFRGPSLITPIHDFALHTKIWETKFFAVYRGALYYEGTLSFSLSKSKMLLKLPGINASKGCLQA